MEPSRAAPGEHAGPAAPPRPRPHRRGARRDRGQAGPGAERPRARHVQRHVERALLVQEQPAAAGDAPHRRRRRRGRAGRERRGAADRRRARGRLQDRVAQPPQRGRAVPGRGDRRRRHPARHLRDGRPADRRPRRPPLRRSRRPPHPPPRERRGRRRRRLRQLRRRPDGRRRARLRPFLPGQPARQRDGDRDRPRGPDHAGCRAGAGQPRRPLRQHDGAGRDRRRLGPRQRHVRRPGPLQAPGRPGRRPVRREAAHRGDPRDHRPGAGRGDPGPGGGRHHLRRVRDRRPGRDGDPRRPRRDPAPGAGDGLLRGDDQRVAGAHDRDRPPRAVRRDRRGLRPLGPALRGDRPGHRRRRRSRWSRAASTRTGGRVPVRASSPGCRPAPWPRRRSSSSAWPRRRPAAAPPRPRGSRRPRPSCSPSAGWTRARCCWASSAARTCRRGAGSTSSTTTTSRRTRWPGPAGGRPSSG